MKAMESYLIMNGGTVEHRQRQKNLRAALRKARPLIDTTQPESLNCVRDIAGPLKSPRSNPASNLKITKENLLLARRIFEIMEAPGYISNMLNDNKHVELHPGTLNFSNRLKEAKRIHGENMAFACRLDAMKPFYARKDLRGTLKYVRKPRVKVGLKKKHFLEGLAEAINRSSSPQVQTYRSDGGAIVPKLSMGYTPQDERNSGRRPQQVLLEYTKSQDGRLLDVAVIKEPFRDRYGIFGIDIECGQRYELRLSSEEVSSILDGDILVTSVDNVEVWMALLNKVRLQPVAAFAKLADENGEDGEEVALPDGTAISSIQPEVPRPQPPTAARPSSRPGSRTVKTVSGIAGNNVAFDSGSRDVQLDVRQEISDTNAVATPSSSPTKGVGARKPSVQAPEARAKFVSRINEPQAPTVPAPISRRSIVAKPGNAPSPSNPIAGPPSSKPPQHRTGRASIVGRKKSMDTEKNKTVKDVAVQFVEVTLSEAINRISVRNL